MKLISKLFLILAVGALSLGTTACSSDSEDTPGFEVSELIVSKTDLGFSRPGGSTTISVQSVVTPTATSDASWLTCTVGATSPNLKATSITILCQANDSKDERKATITVSAGGNSKQINVVQSADLVVVSIEPAVVPGEGGQVLVTIKHDATPSVNISTAAASWIEYGGTRAMTQSQLIFKVAEHYGDPREGVITISVKNGQTTISEDITIRQEGRDLPESDMNSTAMELASRMYPGWNLGNTLEAPGSNVNAETSWQKTKTTQEVIDFVKAQGFKSIRIPCSWKCHMDASNKIDADWMARVKTIVDYCIKDGLYVVLNDHWDNGWLENNISPYSDDRAKILKTMWTQIATNFADYGEELLFAGLNEPNADSQAKTNDLVRYEQVFIDAVRATGGNNALRTLLVQGPNTDIDNTGKYYTTLPTDEAKDRLMVEVHFYSPWNFCGMEKDESWGKMFYFWGAGNHVSGSSYNANWGEEQYVKDQMKKMKTQFVDKGIPVYIGEYSCLWREIGENQDKHDASVRLFHEVVVRECINNGCIPVLWDPNSCNHGGTKGSMSVLNRSTLSVWNTFALEGIQAGVAAAQWPK